MYSYNIGIAIAYTVIRKCIFRLSKNPSETNNDKISKIELSLCKQIVTKCQNSNLDVTIICVACGGAKPYRERMGGTATENQLNALTLKMYFTHINTII